MKKWVERKRAKEAERVHCTVFPTKVAYRTSIGAKAIAEKQKIRSGRDMYIYTCGSHWHVTSMPRYRYRMVDKKNKV